MSIKNQFPYFSQPQNKDLVYLDSAATTHKPISVINAITEFYTDQYATVHRASYKQANTATELYENTRSKIATFIGAKDKTNIVWTKGTTEGINLVAYAWGEHNIQSGDTIIVSGSEHHANFVPWQQLAKRKGAELKVIALQKDGNPDLAHYEQLLELKPKLVAIQHCSNVLGNILPIDVMTYKAKAIGAKVLIDGAQAVSQLKVDVSELGCDLYVFSAHKMYGPTGIGVLYINDDIKEQFRPFHYGGEMVQDVKHTDSQFRAIPSMLESGTPNISGVLGLSAAIDFLTSDSYQAAKIELKQTWQHLIKQLNDFDNLVLYGDLNNNVGIVSFNIKDESSADVSVLLGQQNIAVRTGFHCAMPLHSSLNTDGAIRVSLGIYNNRSDVDNFISALRKTIQLLDI